MVDLGCGPGFTSRILLEELQPGRLVGLDLSESFLAEARCTLPSAEFRVGDVTGSLSIEGTADVLFCRLLLSHLPDPAHAVSSWLDALSPGGRLLIEEVESIDTSEDVFGQYLEALASVMAGRRQTLYIGQSLAALGFAAATTIDSRITRVQPPTARVARMFGMNLRAWGSQPDALAVLGKASIADVAARLATLADSPGIGEITWGLRQVVLERR